MGPVTCLGTRITMTGRLFTSRSVWRYALPEASSAAIISGVMLSTLRGDARRRTRHIRRRRSNEGSQFNVNLSAAGVDSATIQYGPLLCLLIVHKRL